VRSSQSCLHLGGQNAGPSPSDCTVGMCWEMGEIPEKVGTRLFAAFDPSAIHVTDIIVDAERSAVYHLAPLEAAANDRVWT